MRSMLYIIILSECQFCMLILLKHTDMRFINDKRCAMCVYVKPFQRCTLSFSLKCCRHLHSGVPAPVRHRRPQRGAAAACLLPAAVGADRAPGGAAVLPQACRPGARHGVCRPVQGGSGEAPCGGVHAQHQPPALRHRAQGR